MSQLSLSVYNFSFVQVVVTWHMLWDMAMASSSTTPYDVSGKERLRWTQDLHDRFVQAVDHLGGPERATPKGILKAMAVPRLTIYHVKSHLQKYRLAKFIPESTNKGQFERKNISEILPNFSTTSAAQLNEALQMHMDTVQRRLSDHLKVQKSLKIKMESQGRFLETIADEHPNNTKPTKLPFSPTSLPSLCEYSESNAKDQSESDSEEADKNETTIQSDQEGGFRSLKRLRMDDEIALPPRLIEFPTMSPEFYSQSMVFSEDADDDHIPYPEQGFSFSWNNNAAAHPAHRLWCQASINY